ncbi:MAG: HAD family hydrolase [Candidatus Hodarchaeota archaeon]
MRKFKAIIFDLDGTLVWFKIDYMSARKKALDRLREHNIDPELLSTTEPIFTTVGKVFDYLKKKGAKETELKEIRQAVDRAIEKYELDGAEMTSLIPGVIETLEELKRRGFKLGIFTLNRDLIANYVLEKTNIRRFFDVVVTRDDVIKPKPSIEHLGKVIELLGIAPEKTIVVGDHPVDFQAANSIGVLTIGVETSMKTAEELKKGGADHTIGVVSELTDFLDNMCYQPEQ